MKIYTKTGDAGTTGLFGGPRVSKDDPRIEAYGSIDELNAVLGIVRTTGLAAEQNGLLKKIQDSLFSIGAELATPEPEKHGLKWSGGPSVLEIESAIDAADEKLPALRNFVLPGGTPAAAYLHLARTVCRRSERQVVSLRHDPKVSDVSEIIVYLNRLSDLLFVLARLANHLASVPDIPWHAPASNTSSN
jgi:cob(I)alamin adenosyltransferase